MVNNGDLAVRAAVDGLGLRTIEALAEPFLRSGQLVRGRKVGRPRSRECLYYPGHRRVPATRAPSSI